MAVLSGRDIRRLIKGEPPLIEGWLDLDEQVPVDEYLQSIRFYYHLIRQSMET